ncbi:hypothetical protein KY359_04570 [Candidatus Woesearchaeota archaeon]|nr:hypothetical protein [Candidatus Woesearchaeota archaeon]
MKLNLKETNVKFEGFPKLLYFVLNADNDGLHLYASDCLVDVSEKYQIVGKGRASLSRLTGDLEVSADDGYSVPWVIAPDVIRGLESALSDYVEGRSTFYCDESQLHPAWQGKGMKDIIGKDASLDDLDDLFREDIIFGKDDVRFLAEFGESYRRREAAAGRINADYDHSPERKAAHAVWYQRLAALGASDKTLDLLLEHMRSGVRADREAANEGYSKKIPGSDESYGAAWKRTFSELMRSGEKEKVAEALLFTWEHLEHMIKRAYDDEEIGEMCRVKELGVIPRYGRQTRPDETREFHKSSYHYLNPILLSEIMWLKE